MHLIVERTPVFTFLTLIPVTPKGSLSPSTSTTSLNQSVSIFGFLNRWNDTLGTVLEDVPKGFVEDKLMPLGWNK